jgi:hypothetical protein
MLLLGPLRDCLAAKRCIEWGHFTALCGGNTLYRVAEQIGFSTRLPGSDLARLRSGIGRKWIAISLRRIKAHKRMMSLGKTFFEVDSGQKTSRNRRLPHPPM